MAAEASQDSHVDQFHRSFSAGTTLYYAGAPADSVFLIRDGRVRLFKRARGVERSVAVYGPESLVGEEALLPDAHRTATAQALEPVSALVIEGDTFRALLRQQPQIGERVMEQLARRLLQAEAQVENFLLPDPTIRVVNSLLHLRSDQNNTTVTVSPLELCNQTALELDQVKAVVSQLAARSYVALGDQTITISNEGALRQLHDLLAVKEDVRQSFDVGSPTPP